MKKVEYYNNVTVEDFERYFELKALGLEQYRIMMVMDGVVTKDEVLRDQKLEEERNEKHFNSLMETIDKEFNDPF